VKKLLVAAVMCVMLCLAAGSALADVSYGVIGGVGLAKFIGRDADNTELRFGFSAGGFAELPLVQALVLHPEALFTLKGSAIEGLDSSYSLFYIEVPMLAKYYLPVDLPAAAFVFAGPYLGLNLIARAGGESVKDGVEPLDFGLVFGGGAEVDSFLFDLRYALGLADLSENTSTFTKSMLSLMVGYRLK
jgi:hypothetical protein